MGKDKEETTEENEETPETGDTSQEEVKAVSLIEIPTAFGIAFSTPEGNMNQEQYLVWLGNMFLDFKEAIAGN